MTEEKNLVLWLAIMAVEALPFPTLSFMYLYGSHYCSILAFHSRQCIDPYNTPGKQESTIISILHMANKKTKGQTESFPIDIYI